VTTRRQWTPEDAGVKKGIHGEKLIGDDQEFDDKGLFDNRTYGHSGNEGL
jgi:hypothetical protein